MQITVDIEESVFHALQALAHREGRDLSTVAAEVIRRGLSQSVATVAHDLARYGFRPFAAVAMDHCATNEQVSRLRDDLGI